VKSHVPPAKHSERLRSLVRKEQVDRELDEKLRAYLEMAEAE
jgi:hypothetical protein